MQGVIAGKFINCQKKQIKDKTTGKITEFYQVTLENENAYRDSDAYPNFTITEEAVVANNLLDLTFVKKMNLENCKLIGNWDLWQIKGTNLSHWKFKATSIQFDIEKK